MKNILLLLAIATLSACGGGSSSKSTDSESNIVSPTPPVNTAPIANNDFGLAQNNKPVVIDVLANDTDIENNMLSISRIVTLPTKGSVEIVNNTLVYTPNRDVALRDVLVYELSDGTLTATARVDITVNHTLKVNGKVTGSSIANTVVEAKLGNDIFTTNADSDGNYQLELIINKMTPELLIVSAKGNNINSQEGVELIATIGDIMPLLAQTNEERILLHDGNSTNITHLTTAAYLLTSDLFDNKKITSMSQYKLLLSELDSHKLMSTAGFIKLLVDNIDFAIPIGETTLSLLERKDNELIDTYDAINQYLLENDLLDESGQPNSEYMSALTAVLNETIANSDVVELFKAEMFENKTMINLDATREGWLPYEGDGLVFSDNGHTMFYDANVYADNPEIMYMRSIVNGKLRLVTEEYKKKEVTIHSSVFDLLVEQFGFSQSIEDELVNALSTGKLARDTKLDILQFDEYIDHTLIHSNDINYHVSIETKSHYRFKIPEGIDWENNVAKSSSFSKLSYGTINHTPVYQWLEKPISELNGKWLLYFDANFKNFPTLDYQITPSARMIEINALSASSVEDNLSYDISLVGGILSLSNDNETYKYIPIKASSNIYLAIIEKWQDGKREYVHARQILKANNEQELFANSLTTELPKAQLACLYCDLSHAWSGDKLKLDYVYGYQFYGTNDLRFGLSGDSYIHHDGIDHFDLGDTRWKWSYESNTINLTLTSSMSVAHRTWKVISTNAAGYTMVLEQSTRGWDDNLNGVIEESEVGQFIRPRVNILKLDDLSRWQEAWQNTVDLGIEVGTNAKREKAKKLSVGNSIN